MRWTMLACVAIALSACAKPQQIKDRNDFLAEATRTYQGESRERIIRAAEIILKHSDPDDFEFRYTVGGFTGLRKYVIYAVLAAASGQEKWEFTTEPLAPGAIRASVSASDAGRASGGYSSQEYEGALKNVALYRLFWARVDYMLGKRPDWMTCTDAAKPLEAANTSVAVALEGLCGVTSGGRDADAPEPLPRASPAVASAQPTSRQRAKR